MILPRFKALLFDLDGTLVDSSAVVRRIMEDWCLKHGIPLQSMLDIYLGARTEDTVAIVAPHLCAKSEAVLLDSLEGQSLEGLVSIEGAAAFLSSLPSGSWAVVTSSSILTAEPKLRACQLPVPGVLVTAESVTKGKPDPEPYLKAAEAFGVAPEVCLVFEDIDNGVNSAIAAGCKVVVVGEGCQVQHEGILCRIKSFADIRLEENGTLGVNGAAHRLLQPAIAELRTWIETPA
jgi:sugar-phosphatase